MKKYLFLLSLCPFFCCGQTTSNSNKKSSTKTATLNYNQITEFILNSYKKNPSGEKIKINQTDSTVEFESGVVDKEGTFGLVEYHEIPKEKGFVKGDLNGDKKDDIIVSVSSNSGGTAEWNEIFVFLTNKDTILFDNKYQDDKLAQAHCNSGGAYGRYFIYSIVNSIIIGESWCWTNNDAHCCPSLKYTTEYKYEKSKGFIFSKKTKK